MMNARQHADEEKTRSDEAGFALITVLVGLSVIDVITSLSIGATLGHVQIAGYKARQLSAAALDRGMLKSVGIVAAR